MAEIVTIPTDTAILGWRKLRYNSILLGVKDDKNSCGIFFRNRHTARLAKRIAEYADAEMFEIKPVQPYTQAELDWTDKSSRSTLEMNDKSCRPEIGDKVSDMGQYKTVFLGFPVWWYEAPRIIYTFLESYDFEGKIMIPFVSSGSSGMGNIMSIRKKSAPPRTGCQAGASPWVWKLKKSGPG